MPGFGLTSVGTGASKLPSGGGFKPGVAGAGALGGNLLGGAIEKKHAKTGGALRGAASGAATGATIGSVIPGVGTAVGGVVGGLIGGIKGWLGGKKKKKLEEELKKQQAAKQLGLTNLANLGSPRDYYSAAPTYSHGTHGLGPGGSAPTYRPGLRG